MPQCCRRYFPAESSTAAGFISDRALSSPEAMASRAACRAKRRTNPSREEAAPRAFSSGAASDLSGSLEESVAMDALEWPRRAASIAFRPSRGPLAASPLPGSYDHFGLRCRSRGPNRCQASLIVTSLLPNFSAASWTISSIRIFFLPLSVLATPSPPPHHFKGHDRHRTPDYHVRPEADSVLDSASATTSRVDAEELGGVMTEKLL